ncbi:alpha/beta hydrolase [Kaistia terrae]|uniref:Alpha/beta hydrolase n=1 Tax=Kaistia terrae TaxID=537017 RepID=A0ABW0Q1H0_9HYPH|nr:alpha/beta hydrolase [Kaistia terrae]MCX5578845.1 alpha/beta hydrolase [Kaistia terrae]
MANSDLSTVEPLHPILVEGVKARQARPAFPDIGPASAKPLFEETQANASGQPEVAGTEEITVAGAEGPLAAKLYRPEIGTEKPPLIVYLHGGGFVLGSFNTHDRNARRLVNETGALVVSVNYRLAPEAPFPAGANDAFAALLDLVKRAPSLGVDPDRIFIAGDSAGATLAIAAILSGRDGRGPELAGLIAFYPVTDMTAIGAGVSYEAFGDGSVGLSEADMIWFRNLYAPDPADWNDPRCSPLTAELADLAGFPPTLVITAAYDVLAEDGALFAARLKSAGVETSYLHVEGVNHGFIGAPNPPPATLATYEAVADWMKSLG